MGAPAERRDPGGGDPAPDRAAAGERRGGGGRGVPLPDRRRRQAGPRAAHGRDRPAPSRPFRGLTSAGGAPAYDCARSGERGTRLAYTLGIDVGTTFTAVAVGREGHAEIAPLGSRGLEHPVGRVPRRWRRRRGRRRGGATGHHRSPQGRARVQAAHRRPGAAGRRRRADVGRRAHGDRAAGGRGPGGVARGGPARPRGRDPPGQLGTVQDRSPAPGDPHVRARPALPDLAAH